MAVFCSLKNTQRIHINNKGMTHESAIVKTSRNTKELQMINLLKGLVLAAVIAAPVAISAPAVQAKTPMTSKSTLIAYRPVTANKSSKVRHTKHHSRHQKASHAKTYSHKANK
jgi:hypothetical protein